MSLFTIQQVIQFIHDAELKRDFRHEKTPINSWLLNERNGGTFEAVLTGNGDEKYMIPDVGCMHFLYRGQNKEFIPCKPTIYRGDPSEAEIFLERMRLIVFKRLLHTHPVINHFFKHHHFYIDEEGLAQHYGLKTSVLDLTSNLDIALFFATCKYDSINDKYTYYDDGEMHDAVIYIFNPIYDNEPTPADNNDYLSWNITPIGLQAFPRPGAQQGYSLCLEKDMSIKSWMYHFSFTCEDSKHYYNLFKSGESLWIKDRLIDKTKIIAIQKIFSFSVFDETYKIYRPKGYSKTKMKKDLRFLDIELQKSCPDIVFSKVEIDSIIREWNNDLGYKTAQSIQRKSTFEFENTTNDEKGNVVGFNGIHNRCKYRSLKRLGVEQTLNLIANPDGPEGAVWVNYTNTPRESKRNDNTPQWQKVPASMENEFGERYLKESDWIIKID